MNIAVVGARLDRPLLEAMTAARSIRGARDTLFLCALSFSEEARARAARLGADCLVSVRGGGADLTAQLEALTRQLGLHTVIFPASRIGTRLAAALAHRMDGDCTLDCVALERAGERIRAVKPVFASNALASFTIQRDFCTLVLRDKRFAPAAMDARPAATCEVRLPELPDPCPTGRVEPFAEDRLDGAEAVVVGGRGIETRGDLELVQGFARAIGAAFGATRPLVMSGLVPAPLLIGQSGRTIAPRLCVTVGVSGSTPFLAGVGPTAQLLAINRSPNANIFAHADHGIVADYRTLLPRLLEQWNKKIL